MNYAKPEICLKEIVTYLHRYLKKDTVNETKPDSKFKQNIPFEKAQFAWPLKKGSVEKKILAWNFYESDWLVINGFLAFAIKNLAVGLYQSRENFSDWLSANSSSKNVLNPFLQNQWGHYFFWDDLKKNYLSHSFEKKQVQNQRPFIVQNILPKNSLVVLAIDTAFFRLRSGNNQELNAFEDFIQDLYNTNNALVVFSKQKLLPEKKSSLQTHNYSISFKMNKDILKSSIFEALEPQAHLIQSHQFIEPTKTGCFDRLIQILSAGQNYILNCEETYQKWKENGEQLYAQARHQR